MTTSTFLQLIGGIGLFLYGIKIMGDALQDLAGDRMRRLIAALTSTPVRGILVGTLVTLLIQSSSATSVMAVSFVHAGLMTLKQAIGVIMGASIGTTITAQLIAFNIKAYALPMVGVGMLLSVFGRSRRQKTIGSGIVGFALLFLGMEYMEHAMDFLRDRQDIFLAFARYPILGVCAGTVLTMVVQSSSATVGLTMAMASQGLLSLDAAIPILFGDNIGTTITAVIASAGLDRVAKQAAFAQVFFKIIGVVVFMAALPLFKGLVVMSSASLPRQLANAHTMFNVMNTLLFIPFIDPFMRLVRFVLPDSGESIKLGPQYLDRNLIGASPAAGVDAVKKELVRLGYMANGMLENIHRAFLEGDEEGVEKVFSTERTINELTEEITRYSVELMQSTLPPELSKELSFYVNGTGDIERVGDHAENLMEIFQHKIENRLNFSSLAMEELKDMLETVERAYALSVESLESEDYEKARVVLMLEEKIDGMEKELRRRHIERLNEGVCSPASGVMFIDILSNLERIGDHSHNLAYFAIDIAKLQGGR